MASVLQGDSVGTFSFFTYTVRVRQKAGTEALEGVHGSSVIEGFCTSAEAEQSDLCSCKETVRRRLGSRTSFLDPLGVELRHARALGTLMHFCSPVKALPFIGKWLRLILCPWPVQCQSITA